MRYDQLRDVVAKRRPGWEHLQEVKPFLCVVLVFTFIFIFIMHSLFPIKKTTTIAVQFFCDEKH